MATVMRKEVLEEEAGAKVSKPAVCWTPGR